MNDDFFRHRVRTTIHRGSFGTLYNTAPARDADVSEEDARRRQRSLEALATMGLTLGRPSERWAAARTGSRSSGAYMAMQRRRGEPWSLWRLALRWDHRALSPRDVSDMNEMWRHFAKHVVPFTLLAIRFADEDISSAHDYPTHECLVAVPPEAGAERVAVLEKLAHRRRALRSAESICRGHVYTQRVGNEWSAEQAVQILDCWRVYGNNAVQYARALAPPPQSRYACDDAEEERESMIMRMRILTCKPDHPDQLVAAEQLARQVAIAAIADEI